MKIRTTLLALPLFLLFAAFSSCKKDDNTPQVDNTITAKVLASADLTLLESAVVRANLGSTLSGTGPFTVFAPTDQAFAATGIDAAMLNSLDTNALKSILLYHVLPSKVASANVPAGPNAKVITASGDSIFVTKNIYGVYINGIKVSSADIDASNGIIHLLSQVLLPPGGNIVEVAQSYDDFTFLVAAVVRASSGSTNVAQILSSGGPFTVFAPTNDAFIDAGFADINAINSADPNYLAAILTYHVVPGRVFSSDLSNGATPATAGGGVLTIGVTGSGATVKGSSNPTPANIIGANVMARNGVIHVVDAVLLPDN